MTGKFVPNYEERQAIAVLRKSLLYGRTEILALLAKDISKEAAVRMLEESAKNMQVLLELNRAMMAATKHLRSSIDSQAQSKENTHGPKLEPQQAAGLREVQVPVLAEARSEDPGARTAPPPWKD